MGASGSTLDDDQKLLTKVPLFQRLPTRLQPALKACTRLRHFEAGQIILQQGSYSEERYNSDECFIIKNGLVNIEMDGVFQSQLHAGEYFGESSLVRNEPQKATLIAVVSSDVLVVSRSQFQQQGLHEKLEPPKMEKLSKRHRMLARGLRYRQGADVIEDPPWKRAQAVVFVMTGRDSSRRSCFAVQCQALRAMLCDKISWLVFVFVPLGQYTKHAGLSAGAVFVTNFLALVPLANLLAESTDALTNHTSWLLGILLTNMLGNVVEMVMCIQLVKAGLIDVAVASALGSIFSGLLLILGAAICSVGLVTKYAEFDALSVAQNMTIQLVASISICLPTCYQVATGSDWNTVVAVSRVCSLFLIGLYGMFVVFATASYKMDLEERTGAEQLSLSLSCLMLCACAWLVASTSHNLVHSVEAFSAEYGVTRLTIGGLLLPLAGNACENISAISCALKGNLDVALAVAVGSASQVALFVVPCIVWAGYFLQQPFSLATAPFGMLCQILTVFLVSQVLQNGATNWLHGAMLVTLYALIAVMIINYPDVEYSTD